MPFLLHRADSLLAGAANRNLLELDPLPASNTTAPRSHRLTVIVRRPAPVGTGCRFSPFNLENCSQAVSRNPLDLR